MNEKRIEQVLEIEKKAQGILDAATREAEQVPARAEQEAREMIERGRSQAQEEASQMIAKAKAEEETAAILSKTEQKNRETEQQAMKNLDKAVAYILERLIGRV
jgi:vacuolar-type H+-ATPase subunit H